MRKIVEDWFGLSRFSTTVKQEIVVGLATFMTMAYIIFVNPAILSSAGMPPAAVVAATCLGAAVPTLLMGCWANYPFALASGMGLNAALAVQAAQPGMSWQTMMGVVVVEGALVTVLVLTRVRERVMMAIPLNLKRAIGVSIGLFIAFLGLQQMGWVTRGTGGAFLSHGPLAARSTLVASGGGSAHDDSAGLSDARSDSGGHLGNDRVGVVFRCLSTGRKRFGETPGSLDGLAGFFGLCMEFSSVEEGLPAFLIIILIPLTQSISFGIGIGFIAYVLAQCFGGKAREVSPWLYGIAALFLASFLWEKAR
ncbi:MAG: NCS2 family permease [Verrucomicrobiota bacterium]